jgi:hypothetical protein
MKAEFRWCEGILILLFFYLFILQLQAIWPFTIDDMYISLRYAKNWVAGYGLLWNVSSAPVEGYSNFSFVVLGALTLLLKGNAVVVLKSAGVLGLFFTCYFTYLITRFWFARRESFLPCLILLLYKGQIIWAASGLETTVYEALVCGSIYFCFKGMGYQLFPGLRKESESRYFIFAGILLSLAGLTRPEAPALMGLFFILICLDRPKKDRAKYWRGVLYFFLTLLLIFAPYFFWRLVYFGFLFPNSVYCKGLSKTLNFFLDINYLKLIWPLAVLALPACIKTNDKRHYFLWLPSLLYLIMLADAEPVVAFENRLFLPAFVLFLPLVLQGIYTIEFSFWQDRDFVLGLPIYFSCFLVAFFFIPTMSLVDYRYFSQNPLRGEQLRGSVVNWLENHGLAGDSVVLADSGMIPYKSNLNFIDSYCLNNLEMAHSKDRYKQFCEKILQRNPKIVILTSLISRGKVTYTPSDFCLKNLLNTQNKYKLSKEYITNSPESNYRYEIYINSSIFSSRKNKVY